MKKTYPLLFVLIATTTFAQQPGWQGKFEQLGELLPTPNSYRTSSGAPGVNYWQQKADYVINVELNDETHVLTGSETITYHNNAPEALGFLWVQLDQNINADKSMTRMTSGSRLRDSIPAKLIASASGAYNYEGGFAIKSVKGTNGIELPFTINYTMMRVDLPQPLKTGESLAFSIEWSYNVNDRMMFSDRGGMEFFPEDGNYIYTIAQWFPRMCVFDDYEGWQNKQFLDDGEFALTFGNYDVKITVPSDHIVGATGTLQNAQEVLSAVQMERLNQAKSSLTTPVFIVTADEALRKEKQHASGKSTWSFKAENVRDFAFATSRKFIWDAMAVKIGDNTVVAQSMYSKEANPLWERESTKAIKNALEVYSARTFNYPYAAVTSVNWVGGGMEYPMICFNAGRPARDGTITNRTTTNMVSVVVHEVGHNFFPMIVNSDERQSTWMDEGLNSFLEKETMQERYPDLNYRDNTPETIVAFMRGDKTNMRPIMASSDNQAGSFGANGYSKPAAALTVLRETVMGPELFDMAFKEYAQRWAFKHPKPADFFRTMEDASAIDLDWFWRGWFYSTDNVDLNLDEVKWFIIKNETLDPENRNVTVRQGNLGAGNNTKTTDFSNGPTPFTVSDTPENLYGEFRNRLDDNDVRRQLTGKNVYEISVINKGGLITPVIVQWTYMDGTTETDYLPAEIWRTNESIVSKVFVKNKEVTKVEIDPDKKTGDVNVMDNAFPKRQTSQFEQFRRGR